MLITYTYRVTPEDGSFSIECLENDSIFTCCFRREDIEPMTTEVTELMLEDYAAAHSHPPIPAFRQPGPDEFQLTFELTTGRRVRPEKVKA